jgi:hypothetical protein
MEKHYKIPQSVLTKETVEWRPGKPVHKIKQETVITKPLIKIVEDMLIDWFLREQPKADEIKLVKNSLKQVDTTHNIWVARVQTFIHFPKSETKIHESVVRFKVDSAKHKSDPFKDFYSIHHNHVIFPT